MFVSAGGRCPAAADEEAAALSACALRFDGQREADDKRWGDERHLDRERWSDARFEALWMATHRLSCGQFSRA
jgi:hypothetical protein